MDQDERNAIKIARRKEMANHLEEIARHMSAMLTMWYEHDLEGDFLADEEYPFTMSLDEQLAEVNAAVECIREVNDFLELTPVTITVGPREYAELTKLLEREPQELPKLRALLAREGLECYLG